MVREFEFVPMRSGILLVVLVVAAHLLSAGAWSQSDDDEEKESFGETLTVTATKWGEIKVQEIPGAVTACNSPLDFIEVRLGWGSQL